MAYTKVTGSLVDIGDLDLTNVGQIQLDSIAGDADSNTSITFSGSDVITIATGGSGRLTIGDGALSPVTDNQIDLGTSSLEFKDGYFDGTVTADAFAGPLTGNVTGNVSGTAATVTTAAQTNITSLGTLTALTVDDITIDGSSITDSGGLGIVCGEILTVDVTSTIILDSDAGQISFKDGGTEIGVFENSSSDFKIESKVSNKDIIFAGNDGGSAVTAMTIDMSEGGNVLIGGTTDRSRKLVVEGTGDLMTLYSTNGGTGGAQLDLIHHSGSAADGDSIGIINFSTNDRQLASIKGVATDLDGRGKFHIGVRESASAYNHDAMTIACAGDETYLDIFCDSGGSRGAGYFRFSTDGASTQQPVAQIYMEQGSGDGASQKSNMYFQVADNANPTTAMYIQNNKVVTTMADLEVTNDIKMLNNGRGISFAADTEDEIGAGSVGSETLHDYEEGTWTPGHNGASFQTALGSYTKIGNKVFCQFKVVAAADGATSGDWSGLPFTIRNSSDLGIGGGSVGYHNATSETWSISCENVNTTTFSIRRGPTQKQLPQGDQMWGTINYLV